MSGFVFPSPSVTEFQIEINGYLLALEEILVSFDK
jgi:hypothetical protein